MADTFTTLSAASPSAEKMSFGIPSATACGDQATGGANTATLTAVTNQQWFLTYICLTFGATITSACTLTITDGVGGSTIFGPVRIPTITNPIPIVIDFQTRPIHASVGNALQAVLTTPGAAVPNNVSITGFLAIKP